jgi:hypothetical protein
MQDDSTKTLRRLWHLNAMQLESFPRGLGHSEEVVGHLLRKLPPSQHPLVFHKMRAGIGAATVKLTVADLEEIAQAIERTGAGSGPTMPQLQRAA